MVINVDDDADDDGDVDDAGDDDGGDDDDDDNDDDDGDEEGDDGDDEDDSDEDDEGDDDGGGEDDGDDHDDEDDDDDGDQRKMMMLMLMLKRRKMMMWRRRRMLRRKADPKTRKHALCEPAQSKCRRTLHKSHFVWKIKKKWPRAPPGTSFCASLRSGNADEHCTTGKMAADTSGDIVLCEPAQSKCTWTCHKRHFVQKFTGKMPDASDTTSIEHWALTPTIRTPQCGHTVWGIKDSLNPTILT